MGECQSLYFTYNILMWLKKQYHPHLRKAAVSVGFIFIQEINEMRFEREGEGESEKVWVEIGSGMHHSGEVWFVCSNLDAEPAEFGNDYVPASGVKGLEERLQSWAEKNRFKLVPDEGAIS